jgi:hypothetical protein
MAVNGNGSLVLPLGLNDERHGLGCPSVSIFRIIGGLDFCRCRLAQTSSGEAHLWNPGRRAAGPDGADGDDGVCPG